MPSKKNPPPKPKRTVSSGSILETVPTHPAACCVPSECSSRCSDEDVGSSGTCHSEPQSKVNRRPLPEQELKTPTCLPECQSLQLEAMINEIRSYREIIRSLALETMDILSGKDAQQSKWVQAQPEPIANGMTSSQHHDDSGANFIEPASQAKPIDQGQKTDRSEKNREISELRKNISGSEGQSTTPLFRLPSMLSKSPTLSRKSSRCIAQSAHKITEKVLGQNEKKQNVDCGCDESMNKKALGLKKKPSECSCHRETCKWCEDAIKKRNKENEKREKRTDSKSFIRKKFGWISCDTALPSVVIDDCVCDDEEMKKQSLKQKLAAAASSKACPMPKCAVNKCTCRFPPAYKQYFDCTGHVNGNCHCGKNA